MGSFTLIRRYGKGSFGQVFAARKEDSMALFALKMVPSSYVAPAGIESHVAGATATRGSNLTTPCPEHRCVAPA